MSDGMSHIKRGEYFPFSPTDLGNGDPRRMPLQKENETLRKEVNILKERIAQLIEEVEGLNYYNEKYNRYLEQYDTVARKFIEKVDSGRAFSTETYRDLRDCLLRGTYYGK